MRNLKILMLIFVSLLGLGACVELVDVDSIELNWTPKTTYEFGEELILNGKQVIVNLSDGSQQSFQFENSAIIKNSGMYEEGGTYYLDTRESGDFVFSISYEGSEISIDYTVLTEELPITSVGTLAAFIDALNGTSPTVIELTANITLTSDLSTTRFIGLVTGVHTLDLGGFSLSLNGDGGENSYPQETLEIEGTFDNGFVNASSVFINTPNVDYVFNPVGTAVFDVVLVELGSTQATIQDLLNNNDVSVYLFEAGEYSLTDHELVIDSETRNKILIGQTNTLGEPVTTLAGVTTLNKPGVVLGDVTNTTDNDVWFYNFEMTNFGSDVFQATSFPIRTAPSSASYMFSGNIVLDNMVFSLYQKGAVAIYSDGDVHIRDSVFDAYNPEAGAGRNSLQLSGKAQSYITGNQFYNSVMLVEDSEWTSTAILFMRGGTIHQLSNNTFVNNADAVYFGNYRKLDFADTFVAINPEGDFTGNSFINNDGDLLLITYLGLYNMTPDKIDEDLVDAINIHNNYPDFSLYDEDNYYHYIGVADTQIIDESKVINGYGLEIYDGGSVTISVGVDLELIEDAYLYLESGATLTVNGTLTIDVLNATIYVYDGATINGTGWDPENYTETVYDGYTTYTLDAA